MNTAAFFFPIYMLNFVCLNSDRKNEAFVKTSREPSNPPRIGTSPLFNWLQGVTSYLFPFWIQYFVLCKKIKTPFIVINTYICACMLFFIYVCTYIHSYIAFKLQIWSGNRNKSCVVLSAENKQVVENNDTPVPCIGT